MLEQRSLNWVEHAVDTNTTRGGNGQGQLEEQYEGNSDVQCQTAVSAYV